MGKKRESFNLRCLHRIVDMKGQEKLRFCSFVSFSSVHDYSLGQRERRWSRRVQRTGDCRVSEQTLHSAANIERQSTRGYEHRHTK